MKDIGILSVKTFNYGSLLQTYAIQTYINRLGYSNDIVNYKKTNRLNQLLRLFYFPLLKELVIRTLRIKWYIKMHPDYAAYLGNRNKAFLSFITTDIKESVPFHGWHDLHKNVAEHYKCILLGSDQVWHPYNYGAHFFDMSFVPISVPKIAYAPSFGVSSLPYYQRFGMRKYLSRIDVLSVREESGKKIIADLCDRDAVVVCDPTMLLSRSDWDYFKTERIVSGDYIFCYFIGDNPEHRNFAARLSKSIKMPVVTLRHIYAYRDCDKDFGDIAPLNIGPREFVSLISYARYICTDSFHGTVFSIINEKQMFTFARFDDNKMSANSRLATLFNKLGISHRYVSPSLSIEEIALIPEVDYEMVNKKLNLYREFSQNFLKKSLLNCLSK